MTLMGRRDVELGRLVFFYSTLGIKEVAIITRVVDATEGVVNLKVFSDDIDILRREANVPYSKARTTSRHWAWRPRVGRRTSPGLRPDARNGDDE